jgi:hypothetical protein
VRAPGQVKGSWGKPGPKAAAATAAATTSASGEKINYSNGNSGFEIPVQTSMYPISRV